MTINYPRLSPAIYLPFFQTTKETEQLNKEIEFNFDQLAKNQLYFQNLLNMFNGRVLFPLEEIALRNAKMAIESRIFELKELSEMKEDLLVAQNSDLAFQKMSQVAREILYFRSVEGKSRNDEICKILIQKEVRSVSRTGQNKSIPQLQRYISRYF